MILTSPYQAFHYFRKRLDVEVEEFWVVALNSEKAVIDSACLFRGTVDLCLFHPRDVFRFGYRCNAAALLVAHNHPSGNAAPSEQDRAVTQILLAAAEILQLPVLDHLIVAGKTYFSFLEAGELNPNPAAGPWPGGR
jgi:DNA repair protein RadC